MIGPRCEVRLIIRWALPLVLRPDHQPLMIRPRRLDIPAEGLVRRPLGSEMDLIFYPHHLRDDLWEHHPMYIQLLRLYG